MTKVPKEVSQEQVPKPQVPSNRLPKTCSHEKVPSLQHVPKQGFPGTGSQARTG